MPEPVPSTGLATLLDDLGPELLRPLRGAVEQLGERPVTAVTIVEPQDVAAVPRGSLVIASGLGLADQALPDLVTRWAADGAAAVVVKLRGAGEDAVDAAAALAQAAGLVLLSVPDTLPWLHLLGLVEMAREHLRGDRGDTALGDLFGLASAVAAATGGATAVEDPSRRILAYSTLPGQPIDPARQRGILGRQVPYRPSNDFEYRRLYRTDGVMRLGPNGETLGRRAVAVRSGAELLGSIWVIDGGHLSADADAVLTDASRIAALHLIRSRSHADVERQEREEALRVLLDGRPGTEAAVDRLGYRRESACQLLAVALPRGSDDIDELILERLHELVALRGAALSPRNATTIRGAAVWALLVDQDAAATAALVDGLRHRAGSALGVAITIAIGEPRVPPAGVQEARRELDNILLLLDRPGETRRAARRADVQAALVLLEVEQQLAARPELRLSQLEAMARFDQAQSGTYVETLRTYLGCFGDVTAAAASLSIHANTFRYRLGRVRELFGVDLDDPDTRLALWLQLRAGSV